MKLLLLTYYEVLEDACRMLAELVKVRPALLQQILQPLADCLLDVYNGLPADRQPNLLKHVERTLDMMALHLDVHTLMQVCLPSCCHPRGWLARKCSYMHICCITCRLPAVYIHTHVYHRYSAFSCHPLSFFCLDWRCVASHCQLARAFPANLNQHNSTAVRIYIERSLLCVVLHREVPLNFLQCQRHCHQQRQPPAQAGCDGTLHNHALQEQLAA